MMIHGNIICESIAEEEKISIKIILVEEVEEENFLNLKVQIKSIYLKRNNKI